jgi:hypothetical protein
MPSYLGTAGLPYFRVSEPSQSEKYFTCTFVRRRVDGLQYIPMVSSTLQSGSFTPVNKSALVEPIDSNWDRVTIHYPINQSITPKLFGVISIKLE